MGRAGCVSARGVDQEGKCSVVRDMGEWLLDQLMQAMGGEDMICPIKGKMLHGMKREGIKRMTVRHNMYGAK